MSHRHIWRTFERRAHIAQFHSWFQRFLSVRAYRLLLEGFKHDPSYSPWRLKFPPSENWWPRKRYLYILRSPQLMNFRKQWEQSSCDKVEYVFYHLWILPIIIIEIFQIVDGIQWMFLPLWFLHCLDVSLHWPIFVYGVHRLRCVHRVHAEGTTNMTHSLIAYFDCQAINKRRSGSALDARIGAIIGLGHNDSQWERYSPQARRCLWWDN